MSGVSISKTCDAREKAESTAAGCSDPIPLHLSAVSSFGLLTAEISFALSIFTSLGVEGDAALPLPALVDLIISNTDSFASSRAQSDCSV